eukprot:scaffold79909_cov44-Phaeocystis_antarctica.AAC.2
MASTTPPGETTPLTEAHGAPQRPSQSEPALPAVEPITWSKRCDVVLQAVMCGLFGRAQTGVKMMTPTMHAGKQTMHPNPNPSRPCTRALTRTRTEPEPEPEPEAEAEA